ncbi:uncharacterized protein VP01_3176g2, partial [Puccinia sorghi]
HPVRPNNAPPSSVFLTYLAGNIGNPQDPLANRAMIISADSIGVIQLMMEAESACLKQIDRCMDQMAAMVKTFENRLLALKSNHVNSTSRRAEHPIIQFKLFLFFFSAQPGPPEFSTSTKCLTQPLLCSTPLPCQLTAKHFNQPIFHSFRFSNFTPATITTIACSPTI